MATKTFNGTGDVSAATSWTPAGAPAAGDTAIVGTGTATATAETLTGYTLEIGGTLAAIPQLDLTSSTLASTETVLLGTPGASGTQFANILALGANSVAGAIEAVGTAGTLSIQIADLVPATGTATAGVLTSSGLIEAAGETLRVNASSVDATLVSSGTLAAAGAGTLVLNTSVAGTGSILLENGGTVDLEGPVARSQSVSFVTPFSTATTLVLGDAKDFSASIGNFRSNDTVDLANFYATSDSYSGSLLSLSDGVQTVSLNVGTGFSTASFAVTPEDSGDTLVSVVVCFARGTAIATPDGETAVEALQPGDLVRTVLDGQARPVRWVGRRSIDIARHPSPDTVRPVRIAAGAFGDGLPRRALSVSPEHALFVDGALVPAHCLVNGSTITQPQAARAEYFHVELDRHDVLLAEGLPAESYLDTGNRSMFGNAAVTALHPVPAAQAHEAACAPLLLAGPALEALRARLAAQPAGDRADTAAA